MGVLICLKRRRKKMEERMRKVLHQDGTSWNVTKLIVGPGDKLRLSPFYPINAAQFAPREQNKDKLIKSKLTRLTNTGGLSVSFFCHSLLSLPSLQSNTVSVASKAFFCVCASTALASSSSQALRLTAHPLSWKLHTNAERRLGSKCATSVCAGNAKVS